MRREVRLIVEMIQPAEQARSLVANTDLSDLVVRLRDVLAELEADEA